MNTCRAMTDKSFKTYEGSYLATAKAGETFVYQGEIKKCSCGFLLGTDSRPRCICCPEKNGFGIIQAIMGSIYPVLKKCFP